MEEKPWRDLIIETGNLIGRNGNNFKEQFEIGIRNWEWNWKKPWKEEQTKISNNPSPPLQ